MFCCVSPAFGVRSIPPMRPAELRRQKQPCIDGVSNQFGDWAALVFRRLWDRPRWGENELADNFCDGRVCIERRRAPFDHLVR